MSRNPLTILLAVALTGCTTVDAAQAPAPAPPPAAPIQVAPTPPPTPPQELHVSPDARLTITRTAAIGGAKRGIMEKGESFPVLAHVAGGPGCKDWGQIADDGFVCLDKTVAATDAAVVLPRLVAFDPPTPDEYADYIAGKGYTRDDVSASDAILPFIYGKPWGAGRWKGTLYKDADAFQNGDKPVGRLGFGGQKFHFAKALDTPKGEVIVREDGEVAPADDVFFYPVDRFHGRDLQKEPVPAGQLAAWAIDYDGTKLYVQPDVKSDVGKTLPYHAEMTVLSEPSKDGKWWTVPDALGAGIPGYVPYDASDPQFRHDIPLPPPADAGDGTWLDVDLGQQVLAMYKGNTELYATMVSSGDGQLVTPRGLFRIYEKEAYGDMVGKGDERYKPYHVENVPWVMHFYPLYALHGVFWHWAFGHRASHGCMNLAPLDARFLFEHTSPTPKEGWVTTEESPSDPGTLVRIRNGDPNVYDHRPKLE